MLKNILLSLSLCLMSLLSACGEEKINLPGTPLAYEEVDQQLDTNSNPSRERLNVTIVSRVGQDKASQNDLISTAMQAAIDYHKKIPAKIVTVNLLTQDTGNTYADARLAFVVYIPDQKGYNGEATGIWDNAMACERGFTAEELTYLQLWGKLRTKYLNPATDGVDPNQEDALKAEIEHTMGKKLDTDPMLNVMREVEIGK